MVMPMDTAVVWRHSIFQKKTKKKRGPGGNPPPLVRAVAAPAFYFRLGDILQKNLNDGQQKCALFRVCII